MAAAKAQAAPTATKPITEPNPPTPTPAASMTTPTATMPTHEATTPAAGNESAPRQAAGNDRGTEPNANANPE
jgi:hypothetical protein